MRLQGHSDIQAEAIRWHVRLRDGSEEDWQRFARWLEEDPARSDAYDAVALADLELTPDLVPTLPSARPANDDWAEPAPGTGWSRSRWATALAAAAALFLAALVALPWLTTGSSRYEVATGQGERRMVAIGDGTSAMLNGGTRLVLDREDPRFAELVGGEATFTVRRDPNRPFTVIAGEHRIQDAGTTFNLIHDQRLFSVEVIEGAVLYNPDRQALPLPAGHALTVREGQAVMSRRAPQEMAGWRRGQLSYRAAPLESVVGDLRRSLGAEISVDPEIAALPFTGSIRIDRDPNATLPGFASSLGLQARRTGDGWRIEPHSRAAR